MKRMVLLSALLLAGMALMVVQTPAYAKTVKGTIVSMDGGMLVLRTTEGVEEHFTLGTGVQVPATATTGTMVAVTVGDTEGATLVTAISTTTAESSPATSTSPSSQSTSMEASDPADAGSELPETASPALTYGLLGLLTLAGGIIARRRSRSHSGS